MNIEIFNIFNFYNLRIQYNLITVDMRKLILVVFTFILLAGVNVGKAQTALPYSINFGDSQEGWTAVDNSTTPGTTWGYNARWAYIGGTYYGSVMMMMDYASECNDYYVSPGFTLEAGKVYTIESNACMEFNGNGSNLSIGYASSASDMSTFVKLNDITLDGTFAVSRSPKNSVRGTFERNFLFCISQHEPAVQQLMFPF